MKLCVPGVESFLSSTQEPLSYFQNLWSSLNFHFQIFLNEFNELPKKFSVEKPIRLNEQNSIVKRDFYSLLQKVYCHTYLEN